MNLKLASVVIALSLPLAGCGNKGPLILPQNPPPVEANLLPTIPPMDDATLQVDGVPEDGMPPVPPANDASSDEAKIPATPPPPAPGDDGNG